MKNISKYILATLFLLIPSIVYAYDLEITCYDDRDQPPQIIRHTDPLFELSGFLPGSSATRTVHIKNEGVEHECRIYFTGSGSRNILTDKIEVQVSDVFSGSLTQYIDDETTTMAELSPGNEVERTITMTLPTDAGNSYSSQQATFDISIQSEWGDDSDDDGDVEGIEDRATTPRTPVVSFFRDLLGIGGAEDEIEEIEDAEEEEDDEEDDDEDEKVLGEEELEEEVCERTLWWIPILIQLILTLIILSWDKSILRKKHIKLGISAMLALAAYFATQRIGCGCNPVWLCENHWILNLLIAVFPGVAYIRRKQQDYSSEYPSSNY